MSITNNGFPVPVSTLTAALSAALLNSAKDDSRPVLAGVFLRTEGGKLTVQATDGFRLVVQEIEGYFPEDFKAIVPRTFVKQLLKELPKEKPARGKTPAFDPEVWLRLCYPTSLSDEKRAQMEAKDAERKAAVEAKGGYFYPSPELGPQRANQITVACMGSTWVSRLIDGTFPEIRQLLPKQWTLASSMYRAELRNALQQVAVIAQDANDVVKIDIAEGAATRLSANAVGVGSIYTDVGASTWARESETPKRGTIAFNVHFLIDICAAGNTEFVQFEMQGSNAPGVFHAVNDPLNAVHVVMPMHLPS